MSGLIINPYRFSGGGGGTDWQDPASYNWYVNGVGTDNTLTDSAGNLRFEATTTHSRAVASVGSAADVLAMTEPTIIGKVENTLDMGDFNCFGAWAIEGNTTGTSRNVAFLGYKNNSGDFRGWRGQAFNLASSSGWQTLAYNNTGFDVWFGIKVTSNTQFVFYTAPDSSGSPGTWTLRGTVNSWSGSDFELIGFGIGGLAAVTGTEDRADVSGIEVGTATI